MDYFYLESHMNSIGLIDVNALISFFKNNFSSSIAPHFFSAQGTILNPDAAKVEGYLGTEIDLSLGYKAYKNITLSVGYSQMFTTSNMEFLKRGDVNETNKWA